MTESDPRIDDEAVDEAAILILKEARHRHHAAMNQTRTYAVYCVGTHCPPPDATVPVLEVERTLRDSAIAEALFHEREVARFDEAIARAEAERHE